jgi:nicotinamide riboside kinase
MRKVIVTGAFSTGKSKLVAALQDNLATAGVTVRLLIDLARQCPLPLNEMQNDATSLWLLTTQISREIEASQRNEDVLLCDRGVPDIFAHLLDHSGNHDAEWLKAIAPFVKKWISTYDLVLFSRVDEMIAIAPDGLRSVDAAYRTRLDERAVEALLPRGDVIELDNAFGVRLAQALEAIKRSLA